jgi:acyl-CoA synthetase (AMP-forming)/AMP-acid ligase II
LKSLLPTSDYYNLYGPTETNVCTFFRVPGLIPAERTEPFPIGRSCSHVRTKVVDEAGNEESVGREGELCVTGAGVMHGYWNRPSETDRAFFVQSDGERWYRTGDVVTCNADGDYVFVGRRDRMVKKRGYRVELGEIEACLYGHEEVREAAVIALPDPESGIRITAFLCCRSREFVSIIALKQFCAQHLPLYMVPDVFRFCDSLPKTSTDKIDYRELSALESA